MVVVVENGFKGQLKKLKKNYVKDGQRYEKNQSW